MLQFVIMITNHLILHVTLLQSSTKEVYKLNGFNIKDMGLL